MPQYRKSRLSRFQRLFVTIAGMLGWRLDQSRRQAVLTFLGILLTAVISFRLTDTHLANLVGATSHRPAAGPALAYMVGVWLVYYVGHALVYVGGLHRWLRHKLGAERAYEIYSTVLGIVYFNIAWSQAPFLAALGGTLHLHMTGVQVFLASLVIFLATFPVKIWATLHLGIDGYYYRDMFLEERRSEGPITSGPYAFFSDPMYSIGYCQVYAGAFYAQSFEGLVAGVLMHVSIYVFNLVIERPYVRRMYGSTAVPAVSPVEVTVG